jgi:glutamyl-tRNA synthetase
MAVTRFAPSPTGYLHIGNARAAVWNWLVARKTGGTFILRLDDTDAERSRPEYAAAILEDMAWLGLHHDRLERQSDRLARYRAVLEELKARGAVYAAYETAEELEAKRRRQHMRGLPPVYDRAALSLGEVERDALEAAGRRPHWRFRLSGNAVTWQDGVRGETRIETSSLSDPVLVREDGTILYAFASVVDDADMGVTDIIRGEDHVTNTAVQIELFHAIGAVPPRFAHQNLIVSASGEEMSKRTGSLSLRSFREAGAEPQAVAAIAAFAGTSEAPRAVKDIMELAALADPAIVNRAPARFDTQEIMQLTAKLVHQIEPTEAMARLPDAGLDAAMFARFWLAVRGNLGTVAEGRTWLAIVFGTVQTTQIEADFAEAALSLLPQEPFDETTFRNWTDAIRLATGRKGKALFMPLRLALTGLEHGPELGPLLPLIGRERAAERLRARTG